MQFQNFLANTLGNHLGFTLLLADPDVWYKPETKEDGFQYYLYVLVYVDDLLIIDKNPSRYMDMVKSDFTIKPGSIEVPSMYLGAEIGKVKYQDGSQAWTIFALIKSYPTPQYLHHNPFLQSNIARSWTHQLSVLLIKLLFTRI